MTPSFVDAFLEAFLPTNAFLVASLLALSSTLLTFFLIAIAMMFLSTKEDPKDSNANPSSDDDNNDNDEYDSDFKSVLVLPIFHLPPSKPLTNLVPPHSLLKPSARVVMETLIRACPEELREDRARESLEMALLEGGEEIEELVTQGTSGGGRHMRFDCMQIPPDMKFRLHAHPNVELVLCVRGRLHEVRLTGGSLKAAKKFSGSEPEGPDLSDERTEWETRTLEEGNWLVNETGSVHLTFTDKKIGCTLFVLWSGKHANVDEERWPTDYDLAEEVERCTRECCGGRGAGKDLFIPEDGSTGKQGGEGGLRKRRVGGGGGQDAEQEQSTTLDHRMEKARAADSPSTTLYALAKTLRDDGVTQA